MDLLRKRLKYPDIYLHNSLQKTISQQTLHTKHVNMQMFWCFQSTYRVLQTIQMKLILLCVWAEPAVLGSAKTALWNLNRLTHIQFNVWGVSYFFRNLSEHRNGVLGEFNQSKKKGSSKSSRSKRKHSFVCFLSSIYPRRFVMRGQTRPISSFEQQGRKNVWKSGGISSNVVGIICPPYLEYG